jgi:hypothetical protein
MLNSNSNLIQIRNQLEVILSSVPYLTIIRSGEQISVNGIEIDLFYVLRHGDREIKLFVEFKSQGTPISILQYAETVSLIWEYADRPQEQYFIAAVPYVTEAGIRICKDRNIGCIDLAGNCYLSFGNVYIERVGIKNPSPLRRSVKSLFSPKSSRILRVMFSDATREWKVRDIAEKSNVSLGLVSNVKSKLIEEGYAVGDRKSIRFKMPDLLLNEWLKNYSYRKNEFHNYYFLDEPDVIENKIIDYCTENNIRYALGLFSGASYVAPYVRVNKSFVYISGDTASIANKLNLKPVDSGANVMLLQPYDNGIFIDTQIKDGKVIASNIQLYLDLKTYKGRGDEAAQFLFENIIERQWQSEVNTVNAK